MRPFMRRCGRLTLQPSARWLSWSRARCSLQDLSPGGGPQVTPVPEPAPDTNQSAKAKAWKGTGWKMFEAAATTFASIAVLGFAGYSYHWYYKRLVLRKIDHAFTPGDPALAVAGTPGPDADAIEREEQAVVDGIVDGSLRGHYYLLVGEKGTGKTSMILNAMRKTNGNRVSLLEAHGDMEIFRIRLGKALDFEFHEDYIGSLFSIRGPRDTTALLDIERALNKLEKVAQARREREGGPLLLVINDAHLVRDDDDGRNLLEMLQQRAENWAASNLITLVFNSDDYWVYDRLKRLSNRMRVIPVRDLPKRQAVEVLRTHRARFFETAPSAAQLDAVYEQVGGRLAFLARVARVPDMLAESRAIVRQEKAWFLSKCWILGPDMDDDVMDEQKHASAAMVLAKALVDLEKEAGTKAGAEPDADASHALPQLPLHEARQVMTRADFIHSYDSDNLFTIDSAGNVRADSVAMQHAFREICAQPGFDAHLDGTLDRISDIESLGRTRELTVKDFRQGGKFEAVMRDWKGRETGTLDVGVVKRADGEADGDDE